LTSPLQHHLFARRPPWQNHLRSPAGSSAVRCAASCQAKSRLCAGGTRVGVLFVCWPASNGTIAASLRRRVQSSRHTPLCRQPGGDG
jgi:LSD1 subclass zinc finger protein